MLSKVLLTPVDSLVDIVKNNPKCTSNFVAKKLNMNIEVVERWLVILEEFKVLKVQYKGFQGFISYVEKAEEKSSDVDVEQLKDIFISKSKAKNLSYEKMRKLWPMFIHEHETDIRLLFEKKAIAAGHKNSIQLNNAWMKYKEELNNF